MNREQDAECDCGHPRSAHRMNYGGPKDASGRGTVRESCVALVTRKHRGGEDSWPCPCVNFAAALPGTGIRTTE